MQIDQQLIYIVILIFTAETLLLISVVIVYLKQVAKYVKLKDIVEAKLEKDEGQVQAQARKIIDDANQKAREIVSKATEFGNDQKEKYQEYVSNSVQLYVKKYQETLINFQNELTRILSSIPGDINKQVTGEIKAFTESIQKELGNTQTQLRNYLEVGYKNVQNELEAYKVGRARQLDAVIIRVIEQVSKKVLAKEITIQEHEKLVIKALEEAKRQHGLSSLEETNN